MTEPIEISEIKSFFQEKIQNFRDEYDKLDDEDKPFVPKTQFYQFPCQVQVFCIYSPIEFQLVLLYHDPDREDREITVNGPYLGEDFFEEVQKLMDTDWWQKTVPNNDDIDHPLISPEIGYHGKKYSDYLIIPLAEFIQLIRDSPFIKTRMGFYGSSSFQGTDFYTIIRGSVTELDDDELSYLDYIECAKGEAKRRRESISHNDDSFEKQKKTVDANHSLQNVLGTYCYPYVRIGENIELSFREKFLGAIGRPYNHPTVDFTFQFGDYNGFYDTFGFFGIQNAKNGEAIQILNLIFGISNLYGYELHSAREHDLFEGSLNPETKEFGINLYCNKNSRKDAIFTYGKRQIHIPKSDMEKILSTLATVHQNKDLQESVQFLLESVTHHKNGEDTQSFIFSWLITEKEISQIFTDLLHDRNVSKKRQKKFDSFDKWTTESKIEMLQICGYIAKEDYDYLINQNKNRNKIVHEGIQISQSDSSQLLNFATNLLKNRLITAEQPDN